MRYLTTHNLASVAILFPACRWLPDHDQVTYGQISRSLRPASLVNGKDDALRASLTVAQDIGLVISSDDFREDALAVTCQLSEWMQNLREKWYHDPVSFRALVRSALLAKAVDDITSNQTPSDVAVGLAWLLAQDPAEPPAAGWGSGARGDFTDQKLRSFVNTAEQWRALLRWAQALGCATVASGTPQAGRFVLPDPTSAIREELPALPPGGLTAAEFRDGLIKSLPILDGGSISDYMLSVRAPAPDARGEAMVGPAFSFALKRLQNRQIISLREESDASSRVSCTLHGTNWTFDRVTYGAGSRDD